MPQMISQVDKAIISAVMAELASRNKGIPKPKSAENGKKVDDQKGLKIKLKTLDRVFHLNYI